jgi:hypothetical protein
MKHLNVLTLLLLLLTTTQIKSEYTKFIYPDNWNSNFPKLQVQSIDKIKSCNLGERLGQYYRKNSEYIIKTTNHQVNGKSYVIITDHSELDYLNSVEKLAKFRNAKIIKLKNLSTIFDNAKEFESTLTELKNYNPKYVAIIPKVESYNENMLLGMFELLCNFDDDKEIDVYPGVLMGSTPKQFNLFVENIINYKQLDKSHLNPLLGCMVPNNRELRSLQKNGIIHNYLEDLKIKSQILNIYNTKAKNGAELSGDFVYKMDMAPKKFIKNPTPKAKELYEQSNMYIFHGHGLPGISCGLDAEGLPKSMSNKIVLCGSCFSASTQNSNLKPNRLSPDGYEIIPRKSFALEAIEKGATMVYGHMRLNQGFPLLFPVLNNLLDGKSIGQTYQELINSILKTGRFDVKKLAIREKPKNPRRVAQNQLLYVIFGDPALVPILN